MRSNDDVGSSAGDYSLDLRLLGLGADVRFVPKADARGSNCNRCYCRKLPIFRQQFAFHSGSIMVVRRAL